MRVALALLSLLLGTIYTGYGVITAIDLHRGWRTLGFSHFGAAWIAMAFTCGPHHFEHGLHLAFAGRAPGWAELATVLVGLPFGAVWLFLRIEALVGGRGDRFVTGTPPWLRAFPLFCLAYLLACTVTLAALAAHRWSFRPTMVPNVHLIVLYMMIGWYLLTTQLRHRRPLGGWSVSGLSLTCVFPTCAIMHAAWLVYAARGVYDIDTHGLVIDWLSVPAALYFLWVVRSLHLGAGTDWNRGRESIVAPERVAVS